uniref:Uncharacterized protein n=1 Tax=Chromera velia CCMP2878 TaxID=1169474 RepID=A0A0G4G6S0_9ALVE|eukprot:Cvel_20522.t1-p1 / transcript=Cvel_20522.t1 / gene=Cvel_20522 / organism=Chromera_velia_CCMP2878 / gene_product=hypothetical protein / transcript_product=hypothetical protein / location=Cvel_scaffold1848:20941-23912(-) / protein_length=100 / sequence_SO=supercontig / SO=protein_coding / is_pseudo=false
MVTLPRTLSAEENRTPFASGHVPELGTVIGLTSGGVPRDQDSAFGFLAFRNLARSRQASSGFVVSFLAALAVFPRFSHPARISDLETFEVVAALLVLDLV